MRAMGQSCRLVVGRAVEVLERVAVVVVESANGFGAEED
jgi:hypothetical protein